MAILELVETNMKKILYVLLAFVVLGALLVAIPWLGFWAVNTLFAFDIPFTWGTGLAFWVLIALFRGGETTFRRGTEV